MSSEIWDPNSYSTGSFLDGKKVTVAEAEFVRHNCRGNCGETGALRIRYHIPDVAEDKQPYPTDYNVGKDFWPSVDGETKEVSGPRIISTGGKKVDKKTKFHVFRLSLAQAGFPMNQFAEKGADALVGATFTIRGVDRQFKIKGELVDSVTEAVGEFHGFGDVDGGEEESSVDQEALVEELSTALKAALDAHDGEIPRAQISIRLNQQLGKDHPNRAAILELATDDDVLGQIEGITFDKKAVKSA